MLCENCNLYQLTALETPTWSVKWNHSLAIVSNCRDHSGLWQKKALKIKHPSKEKKHILAKKAPILQTESTFGAEKALSKHYFINTKNKRVLTITLFSLFFICIIKFLRARCQVLCEEWHVSIFQLIFTHLSPQRYPKQPKICTQVPLNFEILPSTSPWLLGSNPTPNGLGRAAGRPCRRGFNTWHDA